MRRTLLWGCVLLFSCEPETTFTGASGPSGQAGPTQTAAAPPRPVPVARPVVGGHLAVASNGKLLATVDPDGEQLRLLDPRSGAERHVITFPPGAWPTRVAEVEPGRFAVLLRGRGELVLVTATPGGFSEQTTSVCPEPRGLTLDGTDIVVGCAGGELVRVGRSPQVISTDVEWRDLWVNGKGLHGSAFRAAQTLDATTLTPRSVGLQVTFEPKTAQVAWRTLPLGEGALMVHQLHAINLTVPTGAPSMTTSQSGTSPYGGNAVPTGSVCPSGAVVTAVTAFDGVGARGTTMTRDVLPVDAALSPGKTRLAIAGAGGSGLSVYNVRELGVVSCAVPAFSSTNLALNSVVWLDEDRLAFQEVGRPGPSVLDLSTGIAMPVGARPAQVDDPARALFHSPPAGGASLACASCHPEGGEDGHVWIINGERRRTQTLSGGVMQRQPFHWKGDLRSLGDLMADTFVRRMGGAPPSAQALRELEEWMDAIPRPRPSVVLSAEALASGVAAFNKARCQTCHLNGGTDEGPLADIGTGEQVITPSLAGVSARAPLLHTGEVPTLRARVEGGAHPRHGDLQRLDASEKEHLLRYLQSL